MNYKRYRMKLEERYVDAFQIAKVRENDFENAPADVNLGIPADLLRYIAGILRDVGEMEASANLIAFATDSLHRLESSQISWADHEAGI